jgi:Ig-like domain from next to BRCA1 gene
VKENFSENYSVTAKQNFQKIWTFRNNGKETIPAKSLKLCKLCLESGNCLNLADEFVDGIDQVVQEDVKPNASFQVLINC